MQESRQRGGEPPITPLTLTISCQAVSLKGSWAESLAQRHGATLPSTGDDFMPIRSTTDGAT
jgi:hypothetical protein